MSDQIFQIHYKLLAQSPLLHFQHDQPGAALRATEVKPKLDHYISDRAKREGQDISSWQRQDHPNALQYKLFFTDAEQEKTLSAQTAGLYYGHTARPVCQNVQLHIVCFIPSLMDYIRRVIGDFFLVYNFGTNQNKGFGSFCVENWQHSSGYVAQQLKKYYHVQNVFCFPSTQPFADIKALSSNIRSSSPDSLLFSFLKAKGINHEESGVSNPFYTRVLLGYSFKAGLDFRDGSRRNIYKISSRKFERIPSPIFFKIVGNFVYWIGLPLPPEICGQPFSFTPLKSKNNLSQKSLSTPDWNTLDGAHFMDELMAYCYKNQTAVRERVEQL